MSGRQQIFGRVTGIRTRLDIGRIAQQGDLGQEHHRGTGVGRAGDTPGEHTYQLVGIGAPAVLHQRDAQRWPLRRRGPRQGLSGLGGQKLHVDTPKTN